MQHEAKQCNFDSNHIGKIAELLKYCLPKNLIVLKSAIQEGIKSKEMNYYVCFVEKMPVRLAKRRNARLRHALL